MYNFITVGYDCSPASALRALHLRDFALPFDWIISNVHCLECCFADNFAKFHKNLTLNCAKTRLIDNYGFQFPHDYPLINMCNRENDAGEGIFIEDYEKYICDNWVDYYITVSEKYNRRIERFMAIVNDMTTPIIALSRYITNDVIQLQGIFKKYYNRDDIIFVNSSPESFESTNIINVDTEKNGIWNEAALWKEAIDRVIDIIQSRDGINE